MRRRGRTLLIVALAAAVGAGVGVAVAVTRAPARAAHARVAHSKLHGQAVWQPGQKSALPFRLRDQTGRTVSLRSQRGHVVLLAFLDSRCRSACPIDGAQLGRVWRGLAGPGFDFLVASVDPWADTAASARAFARRAHWVRGWHWLLGSERQLRPLWRAYAIAVLKTSTDIVHTRAAYLIDRDGNVRSAYLFPFRAGHVVRDARSLLRAA
jgi:protein SCO1/2